MNDGPIAQYQGRRNETVTIGHTLKDFADTKALKHLFLALMYILRQRRFTEAVYGAFCFAVHRPMEVDSGRQAGNVIDSCLHVAKEAAAEIAAVGLRLARIRGLPRDLQSRPELIVQTNDGYVVGEYTEVGRSARLFYVVDGVARLFDYYDKCSGVRHLHSIVCVDDRTLLISTGDSAKYLDEWHIRGQELVFQRRLMRHFAGFTAYAKVGEALYFGTDFSERPNYLIRLHDRRKFFLPLPAFRQFVGSMTPYQDRYIVCICYGLYHGATSVAVFDTSVERFIYCAKETIENGRRPSTPAQR